MAVQIGSSQIKSANIITSLLAADAVTTAKLDQSGVFNFTNAISVPTPAADQHATTKAYVDGLVSGLSWKESARVKTTGAISGTYNNGSSGVGATLTNGSNGAAAIDGVSLVANDRVLVANQAVSDKEQNGIYKVTTVGTAGSAFVLTRTTDADTVAKLSKSALFITEGSTNQDSAYVQTADSISAIGTSDIDYVQFSGGGQLVAGAGLQKAGNTISILLASDAGIETNSNELRVKLDGASLARAAGGLSIAANGVGTAEIASAAVTAAKLASASVGTSAIASNAVTSAKLADGAVSTTAKLADGIVSTAKIANGAINAGLLAANAVTAAKLNSDIAGDGLGLNGGNNALEVICDESSITTSSDAIQVKALGIATGMLAATSVTDAKLASNSVIAAKIAANAVTTAKINAAAITAVKLNGDIAGDALGLNVGTNALELKVDGSSLEIASDAVRVKALGIATGMLAATSVTTAKIASNAVTSAKLADGAVSTTAKLADGIVTTAKIANNQITSALLANNSVGAAALGFAPVFETFNGNGSAASFDLGGALDSNFFDAVVVFRNGLRMKKVASSPSGQDEYTVDNGGAGSVGRITFGAAPTSGDLIFADTWQ